MKNFITTLISALVAAVIVTELYSRVFPDSRLALFLLTFIAIAGVALYNVRLAAVRHASAVAGGSATATAQPSRSANPQARKGRGKSNAGGGSGANTNNNGGGGRNGGGRNAKSGSGGRGDKPAPSSAAASTPVPDGPRETGSVKWFNRSKGFGFIIRDNGEEIFVHHRSIRNSDDSRRSNLRDGQKVSFVVADHDKGQQAEDVVGD